MSTPIETNTEELQEILQTVNNLPNFGGGGSSDVFVVHLAVGENYNFTANKTFEELAGAVESGKACFATCMGTVSPLVYFMPGDGAQFTAYMNGSYSNLFMLSDGSWEFSSFIPGPGSLEIDWIEDNGSIREGTIDTDSLYDSRNYGSIKLRFHLYDSETNNHIAYVDTVANIGEFFGSDGNYLFARAFAKEGYFDISFYPVPEDETIYRYEATFTRMT
jgi:hypothetical protein